MSSSTQKTIGNNRPPFPTNTTHAVRLCLFQATRRPIPKEEVIETPHGKIRIKGRLGQQHLDVFEAICYSREKKREADGRIHILVDPWEVRKRSGQMAGATLERIKDDLMEALIEIIEPNHLACTGHLIDHIDTATRITDDSPLTRQGRFGEREMWSVEIGKAFCKLLRSDVWVGYDPARISRLDHGISQAVARHALSHKNEPSGGWKLDTLIGAVAGTVQPALLRRYRARINEEAYKLLKIGVIVENGRVRIEDSSQ